jgi:hypothetical protein
MDHEAASVVYRPSRTTRMVFGGVVPVGLVVIGVLVFALTSSVLWLLPYLLIALVLVAEVHRTELVVGPAGVTRMLLGWRRFVPWTAIERVDDNGCVRLHDRRTEVARVVRAVHLQVQQRAAVAARHPRLDPEDRRRLVSL